MSFELLLVLWIHIINSLFILRKKTACCLLEWVPEWCVVFIRERPGLAFLLIITGDKHYDSLVYLA